MTDPEGARPRETRMALQEFLEAIIAEHGANDHAWLMRCAKDNLAALHAETVDLRQELLIAQQAHQIAALTAEGETLKFQREAAREQTDAAERETIAQVADHWFVQGGKDEFGALPQEVHNADEVIAAILDVVRNAKKALEQERDDARRREFAPLELAAFLAFIRGVDISNTIEQARLGLVERALRAEARFTALQAALAAAAALVARLDAVHADPRYQAVWAMYQIHGGQYTEPKYETELAALRDALLAIPAQETR